jgi:hypothetical protein
VHVVDLAAREAQVIVPDYQLSLAIGKEGQNARLAARLTGWRIDIRSDAAPSGSAESEDSEEPTESTESAGSLDSPTPITPAAQTASAASVAPSDPSASPDAPGSSVQVPPGVGEARTR